MKSSIKFIFFLLFCVSNTNAQKSTFNHSKFEDLLKVYVDDDGMVNYQAFINNDNFDEYLQELECTIPVELTDKEKLAFYINAYNALVIKNVTNYWPINSPMDVKGFFDKDKFTVNGKELTLNEIEYDIVFKFDPVLCHFGLVCAGKSCPKLLQKAYVGSSVIKQLEENAKVFLNDENKNKLNRQNKTLYLSEIFKWFEEKFIERYGSVKEAVGYFMNQHDLRFLKENEISIKYLKYNWQLNKQ